MTDDGIDELVNRPGPASSAVRHLPIYARTYASINPVATATCTPFDSFKATLHVYQ